MNTTDFFVSYNKVRYISQIQGIFEISMGIVRIVRLTHNNSSLCVAAIEVIKNPSKFRRNNIISKIV